MPIQDIASKVRSVLDFALHLQHVLEKDVDAPSQTIADTLSYVQALPLPRKDLSPQQRVDFDRIGVSLWNTCCRLGKSDGTQDPKHLATSNMFQLHTSTSLTDLGEQYDVSPTSLSRALRGPMERVKLTTSCRLWVQSHMPTDAFNLFRHALKTSKSCLDAGLFDLGARIVEHLAAKDEELSEIKQDDNNGEAVLSNALRAEYLLVRIALAWKQDRIELADHFNAQLEAVESNIDLGVVRGLIDLCYEIGSDRLDQNPRQGHVATKWLRRGCELSDQYDAGVVDADVHEMRLALLHTLVRALRSSQDFEDRDEACRVMVKLKEEFGHKACVIVLQLEIHKEDGRTDVDAFYQGRSSSHSGITIVLTYQEFLKLVRSAHLILSNHRLIMHYVHYLKSLSIHHAIEALMTYITTRLVVGEEHDWVDSAIIVLVWIMTLSGPSSPSRIHDQTSCRFNQIQSAGRVNMGPEAAQSAFVLLWKRVEDSFNQDAKQDAVEWCRAAQHGLFSGGVHVENACKVERKVMQCYLDLSDVEAASKAWNTMSTRGKQHFLGRYLHYCLALRKGDDAEVRSALSSLSMVHDDRNRILFVAVAEALRHGTKPQAAQLLQRILDKYRENLPPEVDAYALLRCVGIKPHVHATDGSRFTARLLILALSEPSEGQDELHRRLCGVFKFASTLSQNTSGGKGVPLQECRWFQKTAFSCAAQNHNSWPARYLIDILQYSCQFAVVSDVRAGAPSEEQLKNELDMWALQVALYVGEARSASPSWTVEDIPKTSYLSKSPPSPRDIKELLYRNAFDRFSTMQRKLQELPGDESRRTAEDMKQKLISISPLAFEALLFLTATDPAATSHRRDFFSLRSLLGQITQLQPPRKTYSCLADMILSAACRNSPGGDAMDPPVQFPTSAVTQLLSTLIQGIRTQSGYDLSQASRWIRCVVQVLLDGHRDEFAVVDTEDEIGLVTVDTVVDQALGLARSAAAVPCSPVQDHEAYPAEELEWLATTLFNLSIDLYVASSETETDSEMAACQKHKGGRHGGHDEDRDGDADGGGGGDDDAYRAHYRQPQFWARKAIEVAELLNGGVNVHANGDGGMLARLLREKCQRLGWDV
ncbi:hypothetical protein PV08_00980 [Exophiala spinifera]|uniref:Protein ZIP4 homolog n=1 Tax=Exophiala spinifera TaxID=91928 RepID=A0A0D2BPF9_9EURO|nr:uncharacterized protein PV08_00980 [Exophiala spinifera]KIW20405.1 hypothetical protein PV08_00980 [Exophiala spinifera]